jgi:hypothetical protein
MMAAYHARGPPALQAFIQPPYTTIYELNP